MADSDTPTRTSSGNDDNTAVRVLEGWLMMRSRLTHRWQRKWFRLQDTDLFYAANEGVNTISSFICMLTSSHTVLSISFISCHISKKMKPRSNNVPRL